MRFQQSWIERGRDGQRGMRMWRLAISLHAALILVAKLSFIEMHA
jgi:hypothetical protein